MSAAAREKLDLYKVHKAEYVAPKQPQLIDVKPAQYLVVEGAGEPGGDAFQRSVTALYGIAYTLKFQSKATGQDYTVSKLEGLWWTRDGRSPSPGMPKSDWCWKLLIRTPDFIRENDVKLAMATLEERGKQGDFSSVRLEQIAEGRCVQMLHIGPYDSEHVTITAMQRFAQEHGLAFHGLHHEIYLSDPRRVPPERVKTILRQPVRKNAG